MEVRHRDGCHSQLSKLTIAQGCGNPRFGMVLLERIELSTSPLPRVRSTTELQQRRRGGRYWRAPPLCQAALERQRQ